PLQPPRRARRRARPHGDRPRGDVGMTVVEPHLRLDGDGVDGGAQLARILPVLGGLIAQVGPTEMRLATPCDGWSTRDLLNHVIGGAAMFADAFGGAPLHDISGRLPDV